MMHNSMIYGTSAITNTIDYTHTGLEVQSKYLLGEKYFMISMYLHLIRKLVTKSPVLTNPFNLSGGTPSFHGYDEADLALMVGAPTAGALYAGLAGAGVQTPFCNWGLLLKG